MRVRFRRTGTEIASGTELEQNRRRTARSRVYARKPRLWRRTSRGIFYILWTEDGKTRKVSTRTVERAAAEAALREFVLDFESQQVRVKPVTLHEGIRSWVADRSRPRHGLSPRTVRTYQGWAEKYCAHFSPKILAKEVTPAKIRGFLDTQEDSGLSSNTLRKHLGGLSMVFEFLTREGHVLRNPCKSIQIRAQVKRHPAMTEAEYEQLREGLCDEAHHQHNRTLAEGSRHLLDLADVLWHSGLRFVEATRLTWDDIDFVQATWTIKSPRNKGGEQVLPMHPRCVEILSRRREKEGEPFPAYWTLEHLWQAFKKRHTEFSGWSWHRMRHAFVTRLRRAGRDAAAMALARHSSALMSDHYTHLDLDDLRKDLENV